MSRPVDADADPDAAAAPAQAAAEAAARHGYGRLLAWLAWQWRDIAAAEDALSAAFAAALSRWPRDGVPASPESWLLTVAKRELLQAARQRRLAADPTVTAVVAQPEEVEMTPHALPDDHRLRLMLVCAHPAIDAPVRSALMLQTVLGLDAARIARAFLVEPEAMTKRLVRAKAKIKTNGLRFELPEAADLPQRVDALLDAIYGAYTLHWGQADAGAADALAGEALFLAELVGAALPLHAEALGLLALLQLCEARRPARLDAAGEFVPLEEQDPSRWDADRIDTGLALLARAARRASPGPFQIEAAIQAAHCQRRHGGEPPWADIVVLYERLIEQHPGLGARIGHAVAVAQAHADPAAGLALLDAMKAPPLNRHQPWWAARAHLLAQMPARAAQAAEAYGRALALTDEPALQRHLARRMARLRGSTH